MISYKEYKKARQATETEFLSPEFYIQRELMYGVPRTDLSLTREEMRPILHELMTPELIESVTLAWKNWESVEVKLWADSHKVHDEYSKKYREELEKERDDNTKNT